MNGALSATPGRASFVLGEVAKLPAFLRRDFFTAISYRAAFVSDVFALVLQAFLFYFVGRLVDPSRLPTYGGAETTYMEFVAVGIALTAFIQVGLGRIAGALRGEQLMGTLEYLLMTPTSTATIQVGSVVYDLVYIPIRTGLFLLFISIGFDVDFSSDGVLPAAVIVLFFIPFVWGLGILTAAGMLTFRRGAGGVGLGVTLMTLTSGAYFPVNLLPGWLESAAEANPMAIAIEGMRQSVLGDAGWGDAAADLLLLAPFAAASLVVGILGFRLAMRRERRKGTLGLY